MNYPAYYVCYQPSTANSRWESTIQQSGDVAHAPVRAGAIQHICPTREAYLSRSREFECTSDGDCILLAFKCPLYGQGRCKRSGTTSYCRFAKHP